MQNNNIATNSSEKKYKFLRRVLNLASQDSSKIIIQSRLKGLYFRKIRHQDPKQCKLPQLKKKCFNFLTELQVCSTYPAYQEFVKKAKNLKDHEISISLCRNPGAQNLHKTIQILKHFSILPKNIQKIKFRFFEVPFNTKHLSQIYKKLSCLKKLRTFQRDFDSLSGDCGEDFFRKEYELINQYFCHLRCLNEFEYSQNGLNQIPFNKMLKQNKVWPYITTLKLKISGETFEQFDDIENDLSENAREKSEDDGNKTLMNDNDDSEEDEIEQEIDEYLNIDYYYNGQIQSDDQSRRRKIQSLRDKVGLFFKFDLFPNLRRLELRISYESMIPLNSEIRNRFSSLKALRELLLCFETRSASSKYIFEGLLDLPLLTYFDFETKFIGEEENVLLTEFFKKQTQLVHLRISVSLESKTSIGYSQQRELLENIWQYLEDKLDLQYLSLESESWPIQGLSKGLARAPTFNKLKSFSVIAFDDFMLSSELAAQQIEGFLEFITRHKHSLSNVTINISPIIQNEVATSIVIALSELQVLKELNLSLRRLDIAISYQNFFNRMYPSSYRFKLKERNQNFAKIYSCLKKMLEALRKLSRCSISFHSIQNEIDADTLIKLLNVSSKINTLEYLRLVFPISGHTNNMDVTCLRKIISDLRETPFFCVESSNKILPIILKEELDKWNKRRSLRCDLMF